MNKSGLITLLFLLPFIICWRYSTHMDAVDSVYYSMPQNTREKFNLSLMELGSITPDKYFRDFKNHNYPQSYNASKYWLDHARYSYKNKDFSNASYSFGVASHYILDSFVAPHYIAKEPYELHNRFEGIQFGFSMECNYSSPTLHDLDYRKEGMQDWNKWLVNHDNVQEKELRKAMNLLYSISQETFDFECRQFNTDFKRIGILFGNKILVLLFILILSLLLKFF